MFFSGKDIYIYIDFFHQQQEVAKKGIERIRNGSVYRAKQCLQSCQGGVASLTSQGVLGILMLQKTQNL